jgi:hypothetical protein
MATYRKLLKNRNGDIIIPVVDAMGDGYVLLHYLLCEN